MFIKAILTFGVVFATLTFNSGQVNLTGVKCIVEGERAASRAAAVGYKNGKVYLCNAHCADAFKQGAELDEDAKFIIKANHQLVLTGQYIQKVCPISGDPVDEIFSLTVGAAKIGFSCAQSRAEVTQLKTIEEKVTLLFSDAAFDKAFAPKSLEAFLAEAKQQATPKREVSGNVDAAQRGKKSELVAERSLEKASTKK